MEIKEFEVDKYEAARKWKEYVKAAKEDPKNKEYSDLRKIYMYLKAGGKVVDVYDIIQKGGINSETRHPNLAICQAVSKKCNCRYSIGGTVSYSSGWDNKYSVRIERCFITSLSTQNFYLNLETAVPSIPPKLRLKRITADHYILWEVDKWEIIPPGDPYLLRRLSPNIFAVLGSWDLTPLEKAVMKGRL